MNPTSKAKIAANRQNSRKSTGPRTPEGKARSSRNATRHGLCISLPLMCDEGSMKQDFDLLLADLREEHRPDGPTEDILVFKMACAFFHTYRASLLLTEHLDNNDYEEDKQIALFLRYQTTADRSFNRNLADLRKLQKERRLEDDGFVSQDAQGDAQPAAQNAQSQPTPQPEMPPATPMDPASGPAMPFSPLTIELPLRPKAA